MGCQSNVRAKGHLPIPCLPLTWPLVPVAAKPCLDALVPAVPSRCVAVAGLLHPPRWQEPAGMAKRRPSGTRPSPAEPLQWLSSSPSLRGHSRGGPAAFPPGSCLRCLLSHTRREPQRVNPAVVVRNDAESFQDLGRQQSAGLRLSDPPIPSTTTTTCRPGPRTHPEPLLLAVPPPPLPGRAVQLQQSLQNLLP